MCFKHALLEVLVSDAMLHFENYAIYAQLENYPKYEPNERDVSVYF